MRDTGELRGECSVQTPLVWTLGGPARGIGEEAGGLVFTPTFPCGVEVSSTGVIGAPLRRIGNWQGNVGDPSCPGALALVKGHVQARQFAARPDPLTGFDAFGPCDPQTSFEPQVKLAISSTGMPGWTLFDSDSAIIVPAGHVTLWVFAPVTWQSLGRRPSTVPESWVEVALKVSACPCDCGYTPEGQLTEWLPIVGELIAPIADRMLIKPQRARTLEVSSEGLSAVRVQAFTNPTGVGAPLSTVSVAPQGREYFENWGAPYLALESNQTSVAHLRWGLL